MLGFCSCPRPRIGEPNPQSQTFSVGFAKTGSHFQAGGSMVAQSMIVMKTCSQKPSTFTITDFGIIRPSWQCTITYTALLSCPSKDTSSRKTGSPKSSRILVTTTLDHNLSGMLFRWTVTQTAADLGHSGYPSNFSIVTP
jgi:hypothetical protein